MTDDSPPEALSLTTPMIQQSLLGQAVDTADVLMFVGDEEMRYIAVNQHACDVLGYTREELLRMTVEDVSADVEAHAQYQEMITAKGRRGVSSLRCKTGRCSSFATRPRRRASPGSRTTSRSASSSTTRPSPALAVRTANRKAGPASNSVRPKAPRLARLARRWVAGQGRKLNAGPVQNSLLLSALGAVDSDG